MEYLIIEIIVNIVLIVLGAGFLGSLFCSYLDVEFTGWMWFLSFLILLILFGIPIGLVMWYFHKKR